MARKYQAIARLAVLLAGAFVALAFFAGDTGAGEKRVVLLPKLAAGQVLHYEIRGRVQRQTKTRSRVTSMLQPREIKQDFAALLSFKVKEMRLAAGRPVIVAEVEFQPLPDATVPAGAPKPPTIAFTIGEAGQLSNVTGLDDLDPMYRIAWQFWIGRFAAGWTFPPEGIKPGDRWKSEDPEKMPAPIANLVWERDTTYGHDDKCPVLANETCAAFLTSAVLKQKSSPKDATPEDYRLHELKTLGTARGTNEIFSAVSLHTGLVLRATEDVQQSMNVVIAKIDGSNQVEYDIEAVSHFEMLYKTSGDSPQPPL